MGRKAQVRYFESKGGFYTTYQGTRYKLADGPDDSPAGPVYLLALEAFKEIMRCGGAKPSGGDTRLIACVERWVEYIQKHKSAGYFQVSKDYLSTGVKHWGALLVSQLQPRHVEDWLEAQKDWGPTTKSIAYTRLKTALSWNLEQGFIHAHPLRGKKAPAAAQEQARGADYVLSEQLVCLILQHTPGKFGAFLQALAATGARPSEIANAEDFHYVPAVGALVYKANARRGYLHKNAKQTKKGNPDRTVFLPPAIVELVEGNLKSQGKGYLFRSHKQAGHYSKDAVRFAFARVRQKKPIAEYLLAHDIQPAHVILYSFRHTFITNALKKGVSIKLLADLMGTSVTMIERNYGHASADVPFMRGVFLGLCK